MNELVKKTLSKNYELYIELLDNDEFKKHLIKELNEDIDIPIINEKPSVKYLILFTGNSFVLKKVDIEKYEAVEKKQD